jgi:hypothetical protein
MKEGPALLRVAVVVLEAIQEDLRYYIVTGFFRTEEKQAF